MELLKWKIFDKNKIPKSKKGALVMKTLKIIALLKFSSRHP
jgi:hypothetical protein